MATQPSRARQLASNPMVRQVVLPVLIAFLVVDAALLFLYLVHLHPHVIRSERWNIEKEGSFAEWFQHLLEVALVGALLVLYGRRSSSHVLAWAATFAYVALDDAFQLHERGGHTFRDQVVDGESLGVRTQDVGELAVWAVAGLVSAALLYVTYRTADESTRLLGRALAVAFALLIAFGLGMDMVDRVINHADARFVQVTVSIEDGGELLALSLAFAIVMASLRDRSRDPIGSPPAA